jgi:SAM-dependent methyltransferase
MSAASIPYAFGVDENEQRRLIDQAKGLEPEARWLLGELGVGPGWRAADVGCGPLGILELLAERVDPDGAVVGIEREARFAAMARAEIERRRLGNIAIIEADALELVVAELPFDFVHERLLLMNMPEGQKVVVVEQMLALLRPGGIIALEDWDRASLACYPAHPSWTVLLEAYSTAFSAGGGNGATGRALPTLLRSRGVERIGVKVHARTITVHEPRRMHLLSLLDAMHDKVVAHTQLSETDLAAHKRAVHRHLSDPDTLLIDSLLVQAWGTKPN